MTHCLRLGLVIGLLTAGACGPRVVVDSGATGDASSATGVTGTSAALPPETDASATSVSGSSGAADSSTTGDPSIPPRFVSLGDDYTCVVTQESTVRCWGRTAGTEIGDDEPASEALALELEGPVERLSTGLGANCAVLVGGSVTCWGSNHFGDLGYADTLRREAPPTGPVELGAAAIDVSLSTPTCVLLESQEVRCWGWGIHGVLGQGAGTCPCDCDCGPECCIGDEELPTDWPVVSVGAPVAVVRASLASVCVLTPDGRVRTWGSWSSIGHGNGAGPEFDIGDDELPSGAPDVEVGGVAQAIACGAPSCALLDDGTLRCWGGDHSGYGVGEPVGDDETPASMGPIALPGRVVKIAAGFFEVCAVLEDATLYCWGRNSRGELGLGHLEPIGDDETPLQAGPVDVGGPVASVSIGGDHACAILTDGTLRCWGDNEYGQLGYGHTNDIGDDETPASAGPVPWQ